MNIKTILGVAAVAVGGSLYFGKNKYDGYQQVLQNLEINLKGIKGVKFSGGSIIFNCDVEILNPTNVAVNVPGKQLVVKNLHFYTPKGVYLGVANPNVSEISLPANGKRLITNIPVTLSLSSIGNSLSEILDIVSNTDLLQITADLEAFGKSFTVNA